MTGSCEDRIAAIRLRVKAEIVADEGMRWDCGERAREE
jgi:hypothetical protein